MRILVLLVAALVASGCMASTAGSVRFHPAGPDAQPQVTLQNETFQQLSATLRGAILRAHDGNDVRVDVNAQDLDNVRELLGCRGVGVFAYAGVAIACENDRVA